MSVLPRRRVAHLHVLSTLSLLRAGLAARGPTVQRHQDRPCFAAAPHLPLGIQRQGSQLTDLGLRRCPEGQKQLRVAPSGVLGVRRALTTAMRGGGSNKEEEGGLRFGQHWVPESHVFYRSESGLSSAIVNLRPIVPGHVLVLSSAIVPRVSDLDEAASADLWKTVKAVSKVVEEVYGAEGLNIAIQDGRAAGQSVAHVHVHILPRNSQDGNGNDGIYDKIEAFDGTPDRNAPPPPPKPKLTIPPDAERFDRTSDEMAQEAISLAQRFVAVPASAE